MFIDSADEIMFMSEHVLWFYLCVFLLNFACFSICVCKNVSVSPSAFHCVYLSAFMRAPVFIDTANGFSAGSKFVCPVTQHGSQFIRQAFRIEA